MSNPLAALVNIDIHQKEVAMPQANFPGFDSVSVVDPDIYHFNSTPCKCDAVMHGPFGKWSDGMTSISVLVI